LVATANFKLQGEVTGLFVETYATNLNYNVAAINSTGDSDGNTYIVGYQSDTNRYYVQAIDPTGVQSWIVSVEDFVGGGWYPQVNAIAYNANNSTIDIGFYYYDGSSSKQSSIRIHSN
jgi:hypothetical protein